MNITHSCDAFLVREMQGRLNYDKEHFLHVLTLSSWAEEIEITDRSKLMSIRDVYDYDFERQDDQYHARVNEMVKHCLKKEPFPIVTIHDCFRAHPNNVQWMCEMYNHLLWEMYHSDLLWDILTQITGNKYAPIPVNPEIAQKILDSEYSIN